MKEGSHKKVKKNKKVSEFLGGQQEEGHGVVHHLQQEHHQSHLMHHFQNARG